MDLLINRPAAARSSRGVRRFVDRMLAHLNWPGRVEAMRDARWAPLARPYELIRRGRPDAILWTPCQRGPLCAHHHVITVHDCISLEYIYRGDWRLPAYRRLMSM